MSALSKAESDALMRAMLEARFITDDALGVYFDEEQEASVFPDGTYAACCTNYARQVQQALGVRRVVVYGFDYQHDEARIARDLDTGHDFAVVDGRWLVDGWIVSTAMALERGVYDLQDPADKAIVDEWYGSQSAWETL